MTASVGKSGMPAIRNYKAAGVCYDPVLYDKAGNIEGLSKLVAEAAQNDAKLIVLPEMATTGYCFYNREDVRSYVEPIPGPTTDHFAKLASKYDCYIVVGMPEVDPETDYYYNACALIGPDGIVGKYRKTHGYIAEPKWCKQGDIEQPVFATPIGNIGLLICMDIHYIETARIAALKGADVLVHISCWLAEKAPALHWITRTFENGFYLVEGNRYGLERGVYFSGGACIIDPDGAVQALHDSGDGIAYGMIDIEKARARNFPNGGNKLLDRRPELYLNITRHPYSWNPLDIFRRYGYDVLPEGKKSRISVVQLRPEIGNLRANLNAVGAYVKKAASEGGELVVFPELTLTGLVNKEQARALAMQVNGESMLELVEFCMRYNLHIIVGLVEEEGGAYYNTAVLLGPAGLVGKQRKVHLCDLDEAWATPGSGGFLHFNTTVGRVGILIGHDAMFPESGRVLAIDGVDVLCCPSAVNFPATLSSPETKNPHPFPIPMGDCPIHWHLWRARAGENNSYVAFANQVGPYLSGADMIGKSGVFGPDICLFPRQEVIMDAGGEDIATLEIDTGNLPGSAYPTNIVRAKDYLMQRQPLWYDIVTAKHTPAHDIFKID